jgi:hypothetical protein
MVASPELPAYVEEVRRVADGQDGGAEQWSCLHRRLMTRPNAATDAHAAELRHTYEEAADCLIGCD